jgi:hypothetical protein
MNVTVLVCGDRNWADVEEIRWFLQFLLFEFKPEEITIVEGGCRGADRISGGIARSMGMRVFTENADWKKYGKVAGPIRNQLMLDKYKPDLVVAFHDHIEESKGTKDMVNRARTQGFEVKIFTTISAEKVTE